MFLCSVITFSPPNCIRLSGGVFLMGDLYLSCVFTFGKPPNLPIKAH